MTDKFSARVIEQLFSRFPEWRRYCREETGDDGISFFVVEVPAPAESDSIGPLLIETCDEEVTVDFDHYHAHFDELIGDDEDQENTAMGFILKLLSEDIGVVSFWKGNKWKGSMVVRAGEKPKSAWPEQKATRMRVRSWFGKLNTDIRV